MRYTKRALLIFGVGLLLGLVVVVADWEPLDRLASGLIALGLALIPVGIVVDWWRGVRALRALDRQPPARAKRGARRRSPERRGRPPARRSRKQER